MTQRIHVSLNTPDLPRAIGFYEKLFGVPASKRKDDYANFRLDEPPIHLALVASATPSRYDGHFGVELPDHETLAATRARIEATGLPTRVEENTTCCYARADKLWLSDPDGHAWELWVRTGDADTLADPAQGCCTDATAAKPAAPTRGQGCCS